MNYDIVYIQPIVPYNIRLYLDYINSQTSNQDKEMIIEYLINTKNYSCSI
jgi:hypothetical protein